MGVVLGTAADLVHGDGAEKNVDFAWRRPFGRSSAPPEKRAGKRRSGGGGQCRDWDTAQRKRLLSRGRTTPQRVLSSRLDLLRARADFAQPAGSVKRHRRALITGHRHRSRPAKRPFCRGAPSYCWERTRTAVPLWSKKEEKK
ncbi:hypothetical protein MRX96_014283 [Rhipicephalus microplus]